MEQIKSIVASSIRVKQDILQDEALLKTVKDCITVIVKAFKNGNKVLFCDNGGSAADAQHVAGEFSGRFYTDRDALPAEALHCNTSYMTAVANDYSYVVIYSRLIKGIGNKGDVLVGLSTSGNSKNIYNAFEAAKEKDAQPIIYEAAKEKLKLWKLTENQLSQIEKSGKVKTIFEIYSNTSGIVTAKRVNVGDYVWQGSVLFDIANLSKVWIQFDAYESDLPFLNVGNQLSYSLQALPGKNFSASIRFIDPVIDPVNRVAKVRIEVDNSNAKLKPEMFATGIVNAHLNEYKDKLVIPRSAVLWTGKRSIVYVKQPDSEEFNFKMREIEIGTMLGNSYVVISGLEEGEEIVTDGTFSVDAAAQLEGKPTMMNQ